jgi:hypothetical protein
MPARTLNSFFAGFFYCQIKTDLDVKILIILNKDLRKYSVKKSTEGAFYPKFKDRDLASSNVSKLKGNQPKRNPE